MNAIIYEQMQFSFQNNCSTSNKYKLMHSKFKQKLTNPVVITMVNVYEEK